MPSRSPAAAKRMKRLNVASIVGAPDAPLVSRWSMS